jgi:hypothetical protein
MVFSPAMLNGHKGISRFEVLRAAGRYFDVIEVNQNPDRPDYIPITYRETGGRPMVSWVGYTANPDSALHAAARDGAFPTQEERARRYAQTVQLLATTRATDGTFPFVGLAWWEYMDKVGEKANWGLVTPRHNAYDGVEAVFRNGLDAGRRPIGGEDLDYGDFLSGVEQAHEALAALIERTLH